MLLNVELLMLIINLKNRAISAVLAFFFSHWKIIRAFCYKVFELFQISCCDRRFDKAIKIRSIKKVSISVNHRESALILLQYFAQDLHNVHETVNLKLGPYLDTGWV
jgi:hypothetical protein